LRARSRCFSIPHMQPCGCPSQTGGSDLNGGRRESNHSRSITTLTNPLSPPSSPKV
jgi:hypothetical protein